MIFEEVLGSHTFTLDGDKEGSRMVMTTMLMTMMTTSQRLNVGDNDNDPGPYVCVFIG